jgi:murein DD-endopeptidase MepM/ murein hydrolase activator NlpD
VSRLPLIQTVVREQDAWGSGEFGASRQGGRRTHKGIDVIAPPGSEVLAVSAGTVTRIGFPYSQHEPPAGFQDEYERRRFCLKKVFRYIEVTTPRGKRVRYFYLEPLVSQGDHVTQNQPLGTTQSLERVYPGITPHFHFEVLTPSGKAVNPYGYLEGLAS